MHLNMAAAIVAWPRLSICFRHHLDTPKEGDVSFGDETALTKGIFYIELASHQLHTLVHA